MDKTMITVEIYIQSSIDNVWSKWTSEDHIIHWNFASDDWCCPSAENDLKPGGKFNWRMEAKDKSMGFDFKGTYQDVVEPTLIRYSVEDGRKVDITFSEEAGGVRIKESFEAEGTHSDEMQRTGWQAILGNFKAYVESQ